MEITAQASGSFGAILVPIRGRQPEFPITDSLRPAAEIYIRDGWIHRDLRYSSAPILAVGASLPTWTSPQRTKSHAIPITKNFKPPSGSGGSLA
jgi:hypothetical protein